MLNLIKHNVGDIIDCQCGKVARVLEVFDDNTFRAMVLNKDGTDYMKSVYLWGDFGNGIIRNIRLARSDNNL